MAKSKTKAQAQPDPPIEPNPAIEALAEILPTMEYHDLICTMSYIMQEIKRRTPAE
jgi:hypothetical protein